MNYIVYFDGYSSPKLKRRAGYCVLIYDQNYKLIRETIVALDPTETNNVAEGMGLINACQQLWDLKIYQSSVNTKTCVVSHSRAVIYGDSELVIRMYHNRVRLKSKRLQEVHEKIRIIKRLIGPYVDVKWVPRSANKAGQLISKKKI